MFKEYGIRDGQREIKIDNRLKETFSYLSSPTRSIPLVVVFVSMSPYFGGIGKPLQTRLKVVLWTT